MNTTHKIQKMQGRDWALLVLLGMIWGCSFPFMEIAIDHFPTLTIVAIRCSLAALGLNIFLLFRSQSMKFPRAIWKNFAIMAIFGNVIPFSLIVWGQIYITAGLASILNGTVPFFTVIIAHYFTHDEKFTVNKIIGLFAGFAGLITIIGPGALLDIGNHILGELAVVVASVCYALSIVYARRFARLGVPSICVATGQLSLAAAILVPAAFVIEQPWLSVTFSPQGWAAVSGLGLMSTALALFIYYHLIGRAGATNVSLVTFLMPVTAIILGIVFLGESLSLNQIVGMALIGVGILIMNGRILQGFRGSPE